MSVADSFFTGAEAVRRPFALSDGTTVDLPLCSYEAEMMLATFTASAAKARALIPTAELVPLRLTPRRVLVFVVALEYRRMCIGPYREFMIGIPVRRQPAFDIPLIPALMQERAPGFGIYLTHIGVTTEIARIVGWELLGFPKFIVEISYEQDAAERRCGVTEAGRQILSLTVRKAKRLRLSEHGFNVYSLSPHDGCLYTVPYDYRMRVGMKLGRVCARLELGRHSLADELRALEIGTAALAARYAPEFCLITQVPPAPAPVPHWKEPRYIYAGRRGVAPHGSSLQSESAKGSA